MADREDDEPGDDSLRAMRSVWLSMRDEEPSTRGLAELMAAARAQVAVPAWRRALAAIGEMLRRPPVLALATVVLVAGTAVLVKSHGGLDVEQAPVAASQSPSPPSPSAAPAAPVAVTGGERSGYFEDKNAPAAPEAAVVAAPVTTPTPTPAPHAASRTAGPVATLPPPAPPPRVEVTKLAAVAKSEAPPKSKAMPASNAKRITAPDDSDGVVATVAEESPVAGKSAVDAPSKAVQKSPPAAPPPPSNDQLLRECEAAAARGDCAAVRAMIERLRAQDPAFYRTTVARDSALAKCMPAATATPAAD